VTIIIDLKKMKERLKQAQIEECYRQRDAEIREYQRGKPFSYIAWRLAWACGWLRQHGLGLYDFPSPVLHQRNLWRTFEEPKVKERHTKWKEEQ
jgi:hypothetical protein